MQIELAELSSNRMPLPMILRALADELQAMGQMAERVQNMLSPLLVRAAANPAYRKDAQACDRLTQLLFGAASFVAALEPSIPVIWQVDALAAAKGVLLADLGRRLCGTADDEADQDSGELEMF